VNESRLLADYWRQPRPVAAHGDGVWIEDADGHRYLDAAGSVHVVSIGHGVAEIGEAIAAQAARLSFASSRYFVNEPQLELAQLIADLAPPSLNRCYFASGGSEAVEFAVQIARYYQCLRGRPERYKFIGQMRSYHGATVATISLGGHPVHRERLRPYLLPFPHLEATPAEGADPERFATSLDQLIRREDPETVCGLVMEPIGGTTSGAIVPPAGWWEAAQEVCRSHEVLLIADEVVTGFGRTGRPFGIQHWGVEPDLMVTSKSISSGYAPLAAVIVQDRIADEVQAAAQRLPLRLTYSGNPMACAAGLAVQRRIQRDRLMDRCNRVGVYLAGLLASLAERSPLLGAPRGRGLLLGLPVWKDADAMVPFVRAERVQERIVAAGLRHGLILVGGTGTERSGDGDHLLLSPPFTISEEECDLLAELLEATLVDVGDEVL
jgi:adenosylmethionine-8-amino-7-oxononanoate aminotransferase